MMEEENANEHKSKLLYQQKGRKKKRKSFPSYTIPS